MSERLFSGDPASPRILQAVPAATQPAPVRRALQTLATLRASEAEREPPPPLVEELLPSGCLLFTGEQKSGKSSFLTQLAVAVSGGYRFFGRPTRRGTVLYLGYDDGGTDAMLERVEAVERATGWEADEQRLLYVTETLDAPAPTLSTGFLDFLRQQLQAHPDTALVVLEDFAAVYDATGRENVYRAEKRAIRNFRLIADAFGPLTVVVTNHTRKPGGRDVTGSQDSTNGSRGLLAGSDGNLLLQRVEHSRNLFSLTAEGRRMQDYSLRLSRRDGIWEPIQDGFEAEIVEAEIEARRAGFGALLDAVAAGETVCGSATEIITRFCPGRPADRAAVIRFGLMMRSTSSTSGMGALRRAITGRLRADITIGHPAGTGGANFYRIAPAPTGGERT